LKKVIIEDKFPRKISLSHIDETKITKIPDEYIGSKEKEPEIIQSISEKRKRKSGSSKISNLKEKKKDKKKIK